MNRRPFFIGLGIAVALALIGFLVFFRDPGPAPTEEIGDGVTLADETSVPDMEQSLSADLYFPDGGVMLHAESRELPASDVLEDQIATLVGALLAGPSDDRFRSPLPTDVTLRKVYLVDDTTVFLDLESADGSPPPASGSQRELLTVYSLVNTVILNVEGPTRVVLLWNGQQTSTFAGHLDTTRPLGVNRSLIASSP